MRVDTLDEYPKLYSLLVLVCACSQAPSTKGLSFCRSQVCLMIECWINKIERYSHEVLVRGTHYTLHTTHVYQPIFNTEHTVVCLVGCTFCHQLDNHQGMHHLLWL